MPSHRQWMVSRCTSWMRAVRSDGTQMWMSVSREHFADHAAALARQRDHDHLALVRFLDRGEHVDRIARRGDREQHVARLAERADLLRDRSARTRSRCAMAVSIDVSVVSAIAGKPGPLALESADQFGREMLRVGRRAAVAARENLASRWQARRTARRSRRRSGSPAFRVLRV